MNQKKSDTSGSRAKSFDGLFASGIANESDEESPSAETKDSPGGRLFQPNTVPPMPPLNLERKKAESPIASDFFDEVDLELPPEPYGEYQDFDRTVQIEAPLVEFLASQEKQEPELDRTGPSRSAGVLVAWIVALLLPFIIGSSLYFRAAALPDVWQARAEIQYRGSAWTETQDVAIQSRSLIAPVAAKHDIPIANFEESLDAGLLTGTQVVRVDYRSGDPVEAESVVRTIAANYIVQTSELTPDGVFSTLEAQRGEIERSLSDAKVRQSAIPAVGPDEPDAERAAVAAEIDALEQRLTIVESKILEISLEDLDLNANRVPILLTEPFVFSSPVAPKPGLWGGAGFVAGFLLSGTAMTLAVIWLSKRNRNWAGTPK